MPALNRRTLLALAAAPLGAPAWAAEACPALLSHSFPRLQDEAPQALCQYAGKVLLVVNTASRCGYTGQYEGLEALHARLAPRGLVVLGFPTNDFGRQEPGSNREIADFCANTFGVKFPMFAKTTVKGPQANPFIAELARRTGVPPGWNFHKYLVSRDAQRVKAYASEVDPGDPALQRDLDALLGQA